MLGGRACTLLRPGRSRNPRWRVGGLEGGKEEGVGEGKRKRRINKRNNNNVKSITSMRSPLPPRLGPKTPGA